jgi:hypothetical protein
LAIYKLSASNIIGIGGTPIRLRSLILNVNGKHWVRGRKAEGMV